CGSDIRDAVMQNAPISNQVEPSFPDTAVLYRIAQRFLSDAEEAQSRLFGDRRGNITIEKIDISAVLRGHPWTESLDCCDKTQMLEFGGMKLMRQPMDIRRNVLR